MSGSAPPAVSIIVATYNQAGYLPQCLDSLLAQRMSAADYEVIVVDDGSTDESAAVIARYGDAVRRVTFRRNRGLAEACNAGVKAARGRFIVRVDSDDWLVETAIKKLLDAAEDGDRADVVIPQYWIIRGNEVSELATDAGNLYTWMAGGTLLRRSALSEVGGYRALYWEEFDLYLRILLSGGAIVHLNEPILYHREHDASMTASGQARLDGWRELLSVWPLETLRRWGHDEELERVAIEAEAKR